MASDRLVMVTGGAAVVAGLVGLLALSGLSPQAKAAPLPLPTLMYVSPRVGDPTPPPPVLFQDELSCLIAVRHIETRSSSWRGPNLVALCVPAAGIVIQPTLK